MIFGAALVLAKIFSGTSLSPHPRKISRILVMSDVIGISSSGACRVVWNRRTRFLADDGGRIWR